jgi:hypothetical protein
MPELWTVVISDSARQPNNGTLQCRFRLGGKPMNVVLPDSSILGSIRLRYPELKCKHGNLERLISQVLRDEGLTERVVAGAVIEAMQDTIQHVNGYPADVLAD